MPAEYLESFTVGVVLFALLVAMTAFFVATLLGKGFAGRLRQWFNPSGFWIGVLSALFFLGKLSLFAFLFYRILTAEHYSLLLVFVGMLTGLVGFVIGAAWFGRGGVGRKKSTRQGR